MLHVGQFVKETFVIVQPLKKQNFRVFFSPKMSSSLKVIGSIYVTLICPTCDGTYVWVKCIKN